MQHLSQLLYRLQPHHREALEWFVACAGTEQTWPDALADGTLLATQAKGIYKPKWSDYALSVRQTITSTYPDQPPVTRDDGTWAYAYFQENADPQARESEYTNVGMLNCLRDRVPVGVMRQVSNRSPVRYYIHGAALVSGWEDGYFFLEGFASNSIGHDPGPATEITVLSAKRADNQIVAGGFDPQNVVEARRHILASIVQREGQSQFRQSLLEAYDGRCAVTGCDTLDVLQAAHIFPYLGPDTNAVANGLLLRADVHTLFDRGLVAVDSHSFTILVTPKLATSSSYAELAGTTLRLPRELAHYPSKLALDQHRAWSELGRSKPIATR